MAVAVALAATVRKTAKYDRVSSGSPSTSFLQLPQIRKEDSRAPLGTTP